MNHVLIPRRDPGEPVYHADFALGEHSARHLRRILRLYLKGWELMFLADAAELALTELIANVVRHVPDRRGQTFIFRLPRGGASASKWRTAAPACPRHHRRSAGRRGPGLVLVDAVTDAWGVVKRWDGSGKTVWFECLTPPEKGGSRFRTVRREPRP